MRNAECRIAPLLIRQGTLPAHVRRGLRAGHGAHVHRVSVRPLPPIPAGAGTQAAHAAARGERLQYDTASRKSATFIDAKIGARSDGAMIPTTFHSLSTTGSRRTCFFSITSMATWTSSSARTV